MINIRRNFKHYDSTKLTEVGFCPSIKNQVEAFTQAGKVLEGAQNKMYHFNDENLDDNYEPEDPFMDKIESLERGQQLTTKLKQETVKQNMLNTFKTEDKKEETPKPTE